MQERHPGRDQSVDDEDPGAELTLVGTPGAAEDEAEAGVPERRCGLPDQADHQGHDQGDEHQGTAPPGQGIEGRGAAPLDASRHGLAHGGGGPSPPCSASGGPPGGSGGRDLLSSDGSAVTQLVKMG